MKQAVIMLDGLTKSYGKHRGIENLTYSVRAKSLVLSVLMVLVKQQQFAL